MRGLVPALLVIAAAVRWRISPTAANSSCDGERLMHGAGAATLFELVTLGFAFMVSGILALGAAYSRAS